MSLEERYGKFAEAGSTMPSLGLLSLASVARKAGIDAHIVEAAGRNLSIGATLDELAGIKPDLVGITATTLSIFNANETARAVGRQGPLHGGRPGDTGGRRGEGDRAPRDDKGPGLAPVPRVGPPDRFPGRVQARAFPLPEAPGGDARHKPGMPEPVHILRPHRLRPRVPAILRGVRPRDDTPPARNLRGKGAGLRGRYVRDAQVARAEDMR